MNPDTSDLTSLDQRSQQEAPSLSTVMDAPDHANPHPLSNRLMRVLWRAVWIVAYRPSPRWFHAWRRFLLRSFGAKIDHGAFPYPSVRIWAPWNLEMREGSCLGPDVDCYCVDKVVLGEWATVSQYSFLCTATHDYRNPRMPLVTGPITIGDRAWVAADVFVGHGVTIGEGAVVGARSCVYRDVASWTVVGGNPAKPIGNRDKIQVFVEKGDGS